MNELAVERHVGADVIPHLSEIAALRIAVFREWPYLYAGDEAYERRYLTTYSTSPESLFVLVRDGERVVGASTGLPMDHEDEAFQRPFRAAGRDPQRIFYFGESVLLPAYRGRGLGVRFFEERERYALELGRFTHAAFCAVERPDGHPSRPPDYVPLDAFWRRRGYTRHPELVTTYSWRDVGEAQETAKPMVFWLKALREEARAPGG